MAQSLPIILSAKRKSWRMKDGHASESDSEFQDVRLEVLESDDHTCQFCGFRSAPDKKGSSWQEVHHKNDDHTDNSRQNLATACPLCHQCFHLGLAGMQDGGTLIWLPELRQTELNNLCRAIFCAITSGSEYAPTAKAIYASLESRASHLEDILGAGSSNPAVVGQALIELTEEEYEKRNEGLIMVRLLPKPGRFINAIRYWANTVESKIPPDTWLQIAEPVLRSTAEQELEEADA